MALAVEDAASGPPVLPKPLPVPADAPAAASKAGVLPSSAGVSPQGQFTYNIPLDVPKGRAGVEPHLALGYSSGGGDGVFGLGWSLAGMGSAISRCGANIDTEGTRSGVHFDKNDRFCLDGMKLKKTGPVEPGGSNDYGGDKTGYVTEEESFSKIESLNSSGDLDQGPDTFLVYTKDGRIRTYKARTAIRTSESVRLAFKTPTSLGEQREACTGAADENAPYHCVFTELNGQNDLRKADAGALSTPRISWVLESEEDRSGNGVRYNYSTLPNTAASGNEFVLSNIQYTFGPGQTAQRTVAFEYEERADKTSSFVSGVQLNQTQRVKAIKMIAPNPGAPSLVRQYKLKYLGIGTDSENRQRSLLSSVQECGTKDGCLPAKQFTWSPSARPSFTTADLGAVSQSTDKDAIAPAGARVQDLDGDGTQDLVFTGGGGTGAVATARLGHRDQAGQVTALGDAYQLTGHGDWPALPPNLTLQRPIDIDGNGKTEYMALSAGLDGVHSVILRWDDSAHQFVSTGLEFPFASTENQGQFADLNGDGLLDYIAMKGAADTDKFTYGVRLNQGGTFGPETTTGQLPGGCATRVADLDGDGRSDLLVDPKRQLARTPAFSIFGGAQSQFYCGMPYVTPNSLINEDGRADFSGATSQALSADDQGVVHVRSDLGAAETKDEGPGWRLPVVGHQREGFLSRAHPRDGSIVFPNIFLDDLYFNALYDHESFLGDFNGDGLKDELLVDTERASDSDPAPGVPAKFVDQTTIMWNTGNGLRWDGTVVDLPHDVLADIRIADMNGDGRDDIVSFYNTNLFRQADDSASCFPETSFNSNSGAAPKPLPRMDYHCPYEGVTVGTGGQDRISLLYAKGDGSFVTETMSTSAGVPDANQGRKFSQIGDFTGDGRPDIVKNDGHLQVMKQTAGVLVDRIVSVRDENAAWDEVGPVSYSTEWTDHPEKTDGGPCAAPLVCIRTGMPVVRKVESRTGSFTKDDKPVTTLYAYADPVSHIRQGFLGFGRVITWSPDQPSETVTTYDHSSQYLSHYPLSFRPKVTTTVTPILSSADAAGHPATAKARVTRTTNNDEVRILHDGKNFAVLPHDSHVQEWDQQVSLHWQENLSGIDAITHIGGVPDDNPASVDRSVDSEVLSDDYGNQTDTSSYTTGGAFTHTHTDYDLSDQRKTDWLTGLPTQQVAAAVEGAKSRLEAANTSCGSSGSATGPAITCRTTGYEFDGKGRLTVVEQQKNDTDDQVRSKTTFTLDPQLGVPTMATTWVPDRPDRPARVDRVDHIEYAPVFPGQPDEKIYASQTWSEHENAATRPSQWRAVHPGLGVTVATEDVNGVTTSAKTDDLGRVIESSGDGRQTVTTSYNAYLVPDTDNVLRTNGVQVKTLTGPNKIPSSAVSDRAGRTRIATTTGFDGTPISSTIDYDHLGRPTKASRPFAASGSASNYTTTAYDTLDRPLKVTNPDSTTSTSSYERTAETDVITATDERGNKTRATSDVNGRLTSSDTLYKAKPADTELTAASTTYHYAPFGLVDKVTDDKGNVTSTVFDVLGRPVKSVDPDRGTTSSTYYGDGLVDTLTHEGTGNKSTFGYDDLGRTTSREDLDAAGKKVTSFVWDAAHGIGKMLKATSPDGIETLFGYDNLSRPNNTLITDNSTGGNGATYETVNTYDSAGRPDKLFYPNAPGRPRFTLQSTYNSNDYPVDVNDISVDPAKPVTLAHTGQRNNDGALTAGNLGANVRVTNTYDPATGRRTDQFVSNTVSNATLQKLHYTYYDNGLVKTRDQDDTSGKRNEAYRYDEFNRLTGWDLTNNTAAKSTTAYTLDTIGNLTGVANSTGIAPTEDRNYGSASSGAATRNVGPHALGDSDSPDPATGAESYTYDKQGRMTQADTESGTLRKVTYTAFDLPRTIVDMAGKTTTFAYDAFGTRIKKTGPDGTTLTVPGLFDKRTDPAGKTTYTYYIAGVGQAVHDGTTTKTEYTLTDQLGSTGTVLDAAGNKTQAFFYDPYGKQTNPDGTKYTGTTPTQTHRFTGQEHDDNLRLINMNGRVYDPYAKTFLTTDPVTANHAYAYVNSNPTNYTDPTGHDPIQPGEYGCSFNCGDTTGYPILTAPETPELADVPFSGPPQATICGVGQSGWCTQANNAGSDETGITPIAGDIRGMAADDLYGGAEGAGPIPIDTFTDEEMANLASTNQLVAPIRNVAQTLLLGELEAALKSTQAYQSLQKSLGELLDEFNSYNGYTPESGFAPSRLDPTGLVENAAGTEVNFTFGEINCAHCAIAGDATLAGNPAMALGDKFHVPWTGADAIDAYALSVGETGIAMPYENIGDIFLAMQYHGPGARAIIQGEWLGIASDLRGAHVWNIVNDAGDINFWDFQEIANHGGMDPLNHFGADKYYLTITHRPRRY
ncbi:RHS repeat-associated core domain-containing protein [Streptomyces sp. SKN60]|uniref:RHS repeat-associated core domain-containing protein n=1 Tax=Streptomyces sp. SKN60 TaxID=2855506 RepID=UPI002245C536|nr:FG-GAP-like repeat-containing protein [Streptomyces sp. SKN60]